MFRQVIKCLNVLETKVHLWWFILQAFSCIPLFLKVYFKVLISNVKIMLQVSELLHCHTDDVKSDPIVIVYEFAYRTLVLIVFALFHDHLLSVSILVFVPELEVFFDHLMSMVSRSMSGPPRKCIRCQEDSLAPFTLRMAHSFYKKRMLLKLTPTVMRMSMKSTNSELELLLLCR